MNFGTWQTVSFWLYVAAGVFLALSIGLFFGLEFLKNWRLNRNLSVSPKKKPHAKRSSKDVSPEIPASIPPAPPAPVKPAPPPPDPKPENVTNDPVDVYFEIKDEVRFVPSDVRLSIKS